MSILPKETEEFFHRLMIATPHSGPTCLLGPELCDPVEVDLKNIRSAGRITTGLHRSYFGDKGFAIRVYEAQLSYTKGFIMGATATYRAERTPRPNVSQRVLRERATAAEAEKELINVG